MNLATQGFMPQILAAEAQLQQVGGDLSSIPYTHLFLDGIYVRSMFLKKGQVVSGRIHKFANISMLVKGKMKIASAERAAVVTAPCMMKEEAGIKKFGLALEDSTFVNIFRTDNTDIDTIEDELGCLTFESYEQYLLENGE